MIRKFSKIRYLLISAAVFFLMACSHAKTNEPVSTHSLEPSFVETNTESPLVSSSEVNLTEDHIPGVFSVNDIFVLGSPVLNHVPFMLVTIDDIPSGKDKLEEIASTDHSNGHFIYWKDEEITYVTHSSGQDLVSVILNGDSFSLNCGLKTGMTEAEVLQMNLFFKRFEKEDLHTDSKSIAFASNIFRDEKSPINTEDFDSLYVYVDSIPEKDMDEYGITSTSCISIVALMKDGAVSTIILDMPTAG